MDFTTILMIAGGLYFVYEYSQGKLTLSSSAGTTTTTTNTTNGTQDSTSQQQLIAQQVAQQTLNSIVSDMKTSGDDPSKYYSVYQWNFYYKRARGIDGADPSVLFPNDPTDKLYSILEWWSAMTGKGFSGIGVIAHRVNPYTNPKSNVFGANIRANASERATVTFNS